VGQVGEDSVEAGAMVDLVVAILRKPCFHQLRTVQRLGYVVACSTKRLNGVVGLAVRVQSPGHAPPELAQRVAGWLLSVRELLAGAGLTDVDGLG
jgi:insulysin